MKRIAFGVIAFSTMAGSAALAADLPPPAPMPRAPAVYVPAPIPVYNWTGFYIGGNLGVGWQQGNLGDALVIPSRLATASRASAAVRSASITSLPTASSSVPKRCSTGGLTTITPAQ